MTAQPTSPPPATTPPVPAEPPRGAGRRQRPGTRLLLRSWAWGWLAIVQLISSLLLAGPYIAIGAVILAGIFSIAGAGVGLIMLAVMLPIARFVGTLERLRVEAFLGVRIEPPPPLPPGTPLWRRLLFDGRAWRSTLHLSIMAWWGIIAGAVMLFMVTVCLGLVTLPLYSGALPRHSLVLPGELRISAQPWLWGIGMVMLLILPLVARGLTGVDLSLAQSMLGAPQQEQVVRLTQRVETLTQTREMAVDSVELERRRIERDLHDGPQQRLVAIAMDLGMAQAKLAGDPDGAKDLLGKAHTAAKEAIVEMRQVARGIHPPVLTDRGLDAALSALAARSPVPVAVRVDLPNRPSPTIEAIAYFCVSEALTNVAKHSGASAARVEVGRLGTGLQVQVSDDGRGGADPTRGTGLIGLRQRLAAVDGTLTVHSPAGGGTRLIMTLPERAEPARSGDPKTTPRSTT